MKIALFITFTLATSFAAENSCAGRCGDIFDIKYSCQCDDQCEITGDCCSDYSVQCYDSCTDLCDRPFNKSRSCQCNSQCWYHEDCCVDYHERCIKNNSGGPCSLQPVSNAEIKQISLELWGLDLNRFPTGAITYSIQNQSTSAANDAAPNPFFLNVDETYFQVATFQKLIALQDNYLKTQGQTENVTTEEENENEAFLDAVLATQVGQKLFKFLEGKNYSGCNGLTGFKDVLRAIWFGLYSRRAPNDTSGFEHSFVGEIKGSKVSGFHSWVNFYHEEQNGNFNYQGYITVMEPRMVGMRHTWYDKKKSYNGFTIGTSPEIEFALYTLCHLTRPNSLCGIQLTDENGVVVDRQIQTWTWSATRPTAVSGQKYVASAYFRI